MRRILFQLAEKAIEQAKEMFDAPVKQYLLFADFEQQVKERNVAGIPTDRFAELDPKIRRHVQAYYGLFLQHVTENPLSEQECFDFAMQIDVIVTAAVAEFSINPSEIENQIRRALLPILFKAVGMDKAKPSLPILSKSLVWAWQVITNGIGQFERRQTGGVQLHLWGGSCHL